MVEELSERVEQLSEDLHALREATGDEGRTKERLENRLPK
jgi:hypothetical protein